MKWLFNPRGKATWCFLGRGGEGLVVIIIIIIIIIIIMIIIITNIFNQEATSPSGGFQAGPE